MKTKRKAETKYCTYCGTKMFSEKIGAEQATVYFSGVSFKAGAPYDRTSGKRQYVWHWWCPNKNKKKWWQIISPHDDIEDNEVFTI